MAALALAGCMQTANQVAMGPRSDLDAMAYGQPSYYSPSPIASADSGGADQRTSCQLRRFARRRLRAG